MNISATISQQTGEAEYNNTLAFCVDENYLPYALFVAEQFIALHPKLPCDICICLPDISKVPEKFIDTQIRFIELCINGIASLPVGKLSLAAYHRLFLPQIFEGIYEYIIYLDADTFINKPFYSELMTYVDSLDTEFCVAAAADIMELKFRSTFKQKQKTVDNYIKSYHQYDHIYRNSGVLVFSTRQYVKEDILSRVFNYAIENADRLQCHDQSALNRVLLNEIVLLPFDFNWQINRLTHSFTDTTEPYIIHFISNNKPWRTDNKYTAKYQVFYKDFLFTNFPEITLDILNMFDQRRKSPKYDNPAKEFISREWQRIKTNFSENLVKLSGSEKVVDKYNIIPVLAEAPFLVSTSDALNEEG
ncbi:glycosyltransferase family 8 protein [Psychrobacter sp. FME5]|uniref:glycosyltransferase family 8 protein n=1 Tax=Psychrobacter sp. FME5 TaxID=2487706 RepID=UPI0017879BCB|nr:glycosyltransferase [Psychrobacter sp. FME5]MBE0443842.1 hypothetical protein [Psychrobacter sp. FME5]